MRSRVAVDSQVLQANRQTGKYDPPLILKRDGKPDAHYFRVQIMGKDGEPVASVVYRPTLGRELECWIETDLPLRVSDDPKFMAR